LRDFLLRTLVCLGVSTALITESLSVFHRLRPVPVILAWCLALAVCTRALRPHLPRALPRFGPVETAIGAACSAIAGIATFTAILSPPNSADAMAYHLPRVVYWAQSGSVAFFPTPYFNQVMLQPLAEYCMLHTWLLTGGDRLVNLVAAAGFAGCIVGVSASAGRMGASARGQAFAALVCATLPNAILQASGAKNDSLLALWMVCAGYFALAGNPVYLGLAVGLALATKATAYLFVPPILLALGVWRRRQLAWIAAGVLLINAPQYVRNLRLSGSPLGYDSAQGDGVYRWRNQRLGWRTLAGNLLRNTSEQLGGRDLRWNRSVFDASLAVHRALGLDPQDPATTWPGARYGPPLNANHEANANNRWHLALFLAAAIWAAAAQRRAWLPYAAGLTAALLVFCFYLKWQPFLARLELPLFILAAPLGAALLDRLRPWWLAVPICLLLLDGARRPLFDNWTRPLRGSHTLFATTRDEAYFNDMVQWNNRASYLEAVDRVARSGCATVEIDISHNQLEYPFQVLLRERNPHVFFSHTAVPRPCAVFCPDCAGFPEKVAEYDAVGPPQATGSFLVFLSSSQQHALQ
jgi:hypothetical protein